MTIDLCETFVSIQGESSFAGCTCFFVRLAGCNLSCSYCDTPQALKPGKPVEIARIVSEFAVSGAAIVEVTGGEPLLQPNFPALASTLKDQCGRTVLVETNGSCDISLIPAGVVAIVDLKSPASGMNDRMDMENLQRLRPYDEIKFVLTGRDDYKWAKGIVAAYNLHLRCNAVLFSPAVPQLTLKELAGWIIADRIPVRLNPLLHKLADIR